MSSLPSRIGRAAGQDAVRPGRQPTHETSSPGCLLDRPGHSGAQAKLDGLTQAAHRHQAALERSELKLQATRAEYAGDVRDLYTRGPLAPLELLLAAGDLHKLAVAAASGRARALGFAHLADISVPNKTAAAAGRAALSQVGEPSRWGRPARTEQGVTS